MKILNQKDLQRIFKNKKFFDLFIENDLGLLINKGKLAEFYCKILFNCEWSKNNLHYDLIKNVKKYEVKYRKRKSTDKYYKDIIKYVNGENTPPGFPVFLKAHNKPFFDYLWYVFLNSKMELLAILQYNSNSLNFLESKNKVQNRKRISFEKKKFKILFLNDKIKIKIK